MLISVKREPPQLGHGTKKSDQNAPRISNYPTLENLLVSLNGKPLKTLALPADIFDITEDIVRSIGIDLPHLEHLNMGF